MRSKKLDLDDGELEELVGALLEVEETGKLSGGIDRARRLVELAELSEAEAPKRCETKAFVNGSLETCTLEAGLHARCSYRVASTQIEAEKPAEGDLGSLDDLLEWIPDPGPIRAEILEILAGLPVLAELDRVVELVGRLVALVNAPGGK